MLINHSGPNLRILPDCRLELSPKIIRATLADNENNLCCKRCSVGKGPNYKKILRLSYDVIITYDNRKLLSHRKIIVRFSCN